MALTLGNFLEDFPPLENTLNLQLSLLSDASENTWKIQRLVTNFLADAYEQCHGQWQDDSQEPLSITKSSIGFIGNELLENAKKFHLHGEHPGIELGIHVCRDQVMIFAGNTITADQSSSFQAFIRELLTSNPEQMYLEQVERSIESPELDMSGLGFLTMLNDYDAQLGWQFNPRKENPELVRVTSCVTITV